MTLLFYTTEQYFFVCMYCNFIVHSSVEGYSGCSIFQMLWTEQQWTRLSRCLRSRVEVLCAYAEELASWAIWQISLSEDSPDWLPGWLLKFLFPLPMSFLVSHTFVCDGLCFVDLSHSEWGEMKSQTCFWLALQELIRKMSTCWDIS